MLEVLRQIRFFDGKDPRTLLQEARMDPAFGRLSQPIAPGVDRLLNDQVCRTLIPKSHVDSVLLVIVSSDRALCGNYNKLVLYKAESRIRQLQKEGVSNINLIILGRTASKHFRKHWPEIPVLYRTKLGLKREVMHHVQTTAEKVLGEFLLGNTDRIEIVSTNFLSLLSYAPNSKRLLPLTPDNMETTCDDTIRLTSNNGHLCISRTSCDCIDRATPMIFDQHPLQMLISILPMYITSQLLRCLRDSLASELSARLAAVDVSLKNANDLQRKLQTQYNRARQNQITSELLDVVMGVGDQIREEKGPILKDYLHAMDPAAS